MDLGCSIFDGRRPTSGGRNESPPRNFSITPRAVRTIRDLCEDYRARSGSAYVMPTVVWAHVFGYDSDHRGARVFIGFYNDPSVLEPDWIATIDGLELVYPTSPDGVRHFDDAVLDHGDAGFVLTKKSAG